jgi:hypothetical protein
MSFLSLILGLSVAQILDTINALFVKQKTIILTTWQKVGVILLQILKSVIFIIKVIFVLIFILIEVIFSPIKIFIATKIKPLHYILDGEYYSNFIYPKKRLVDNNNAAQKDCIQFFVCLLFIGIFAIYVLQYWFALYTEYSNLNWDSFTVMVCQLIVPFIFYYVSKHAIPDPKCIEKKNMQ